MLKTVPVTRRKATVQGGANRALVSIPKGTFASALLSLREKAISVGAASGDTLSLGTRWQPEMGISRVCSSPRVEENRRQMDENRKMRAYLAPLFDALPCGVLIADSLNRFQMVNAEACRMLFGNEPGRAAGASKLARFETDLAGVLKTLADSKTGFFRLGAAHRVRLVQVERFCLTAEQGLAADRVYLLQAATGFRSEESKPQTGATS
jgi:PAS domain-containing protein